MTVKHITQTFKVSSGDYKMNVEVFTSTNDLVDVCETRTLNKGFTEDRFGGYKMESEWSGLKSIDEAKTYLREGWSDKVPQLKTVIRNVDKTYPQSKMVKFVDSVEGFIPIVPKAIMGLPDSMRDCTKKVMKGKVINILYDFNFLSGVSNDEIMKAGFDMASMVIKLEKLGYRVRFSSMFTFTDECSADVCIVNIKSETQPLDIKRMMFPMMHTGMYRGVIFGWYERCPSGKYRGGGYGRGLANSLSQKECERIMSEMFSEPTIYVNGKALLDNGEPYLQERFSLKPTEKAEKKKSH